MAKKNSEGLNYLDIDESDDKYKLDKLKPGSSAWLNLFGKQMQMWEDWSKYWQNSLITGKRCMNYTRRNIFTTEQRKKYVNIEDKIPIEPQVIKPVINSLSSQISSMVKSGSISMEDATPPENVAPPEDINIVLKWWQSKLKLEYRKKKALRNGLTVPYPITLYFQRKTAMEGSNLGRMDSTLLPWDSVLYSPSFQEDDGSDIDEIIIVSRQTKATLLDTYPERKEALRKHNAELADDNGLYSQLLNNDQTLSSSTRNKIFYDMMISNSLEEGENSGEYTVIEHLFPVKKKRTVYYDPNKDHSVTLPKDWSTADKEAWVFENPQYEKISNAEVVTLWVTTVSSDGFIWENDKHWFQQPSFDDSNRTMLPACIFVADMIDNMPTCVVEDMLPLVIMNAVSETEGLDEVRKGANDTVFASKGAVVNPSRIGSEMSRARGVVLLNKGRQPGIDVKVERSSPNPAFINYADRLKRQMDETHNVNPAIQGNSAPRQSDKAKQTEIVQGMTPQSPYVDNYTNFVLSIEQMLCFMFKYFLTEEILATIDDEFGTKQEALVNQENYNPVDGSFVGITNDLISADYRITPVTGDDSQVSREKQMDQFAEMLNAYGNSLLNIEPKWFANFLSKYPNRFARELGKFMSENVEEMEQQQSAQAQAEHEMEQKKLQDRKEIEMAKIITPQLMMKTDAQDIQEYPEGVQVWLQIVQALQNKAAMLSEQEQQPPAQPEQMPAQQQEMQPV